MAKKARVISPLHLEGRVYQPNQLIEADEKLIKTLEKQGSVDSDAGAVSYCAGELGVVSVKHCPTDEHLAGMAAAMKAAREHAEQLEKQQAAEAAGAEPAAQAEE